MIKLKASDTSPIRLPAQIAARVFGALLILLVIVIFAATVRPRYEQLALLASGSYAALLRLNLPLAFLPVYINIWDGLVVLVGTVIAGVLLWSRSSSRIALMTAFVLLTNTILAVRPEDSFLGVGPVLQLGVNLLRSLGACSLFLFALMFPSGRFYPRWTRYAAPPVCGWLIAAAFLPQSLIHPDNWPLQVWTAVLLPLFTVPVIFQVLRYARISSPSQRQQTKWVMYGLAIFIVCMVAFNSSRVLYPAVLSPGMARVWYVMLGVPTLYIGFMALPVTVAFSVMRYRLWDINFVINRTLVYGALTLLLAGVFAAGFFGLQVLLEALFGGERVLAAVAIPAATVMILFNPARTWLRRLIDRRLYGIELDYTRALRGRAAQEMAAFPADGARISIGVYTGLRLLGRGGMGEIYVGQHPTLDRTVAIKVLGRGTHDDEERRQRFLREARTIGQLKHPNIVTLHDFGEQDGQVYMVMEYIHGQSLSAILKERGRLPLSEALPLLRDVASALDYAHALGVIHRDIKPSNVMVEPITVTGDGRTVRAVLMDFGVAKLAAVGTRLTQTGMMVGTLDYIAPEQIQGAAEVDARADVYSLGVMAYQMLTGEMPFKHSNPGALLMAHLLEPPPNPRTLLPEIPESAAEAIVQAMAKKPAERFASAGEFVAALA